MGGARSPSQNGVAGIAAAASLSKPLGTEQWMFTRALVLVAVSAKLASLALSVALCRVNMKVGACNA
jgi:hypothetical protein